jgi:iron(III) transport system ATP-binding protein
VSRVTLSDLGKAFGGHTVLHHVDLDVADGEIMAVLGSSGCGKTTMLRIIAGFLDPDAGTVAFDGHPVAGGGTDVSPQRRRVGYVPQEGALFPHLDVRGNILFGLPRKERSDERLAEMLELAELPRSVADAFPHQLSGGQQQRVALARALAPHPRVVLLDEPFSSLDASLRTSAGRAVTRVLRAAGTTALLVTHDQGEALSLADRVAVMRDGRIVQVDDPVGLYRGPVDIEVAAFVGGASALPAVLVGDRAACVLGEVLVTEGQEPDGAVTVLVRPEQLRLTREGPGPAYATVLEVSFYGAYATVALLLEDGSSATARVRADEVPQVEDKVTVEVVGPVRAFP